MNTTQIFRLYLPAIHIPNLHFYGVLNFYNTHYVQRLNSQTYPAFILRSFCNMDWWARKTFRNIICHNLPLAYFTFKIEELFKTIIIIIIMLKKKGLSKTKVIFWEEI